MKHFSLRSELGKNPPRRSFFSWFSKREVVITPDPIDLSFEFGMSDYKYYVSQDVFRDPSLGDWKCDVEGCDTPASYSMASLTDLDGTLLQTEVLHPYLGNRKANTLPKYGFYRLCGTHAREQETKEGLAKEERLLN